MATAKKVAKPSGKSTTASRSRSASAKSAKPAAKTAASRNDAIALLTKDHKDVKKLFKQYDRLASSDGEDTARQTLAQTICAMLTVHATVEEEIFYPAAREVLPKQDLVDEAEVEHASAKDLIAQIEASSPSDPLYDAKVHVLGEYIDHHVKEEEEEMFPKVRRGKLDLKGLGDALKRRKQELTASTAGEEPPVI